MIYDLGQIIANEIGESARISFSYEGAEFSIPSIPDWPDEMFEVHRTGDIVGAARAMLGEQYQAYHDLGGTAQKLMVFVNHVISANGTSLPGIRDLHALIAEHGQAIEYDLMTLSLDIRDLGTPRLTYRRLLIALENLPRTASFVSAAAGEAADWSVTDHLLAAVFDALNIANWQRGGGKGRRPKPLQRPGVEDTTRKVLGKPVSREELDRILGR